MFLIMSETFRAEWASSRLAFTCEDCAHFAADREACAVLYPTTPHRRATIEATADGERVYFCKMFEAPSSGD